MSIVNQDDKSPHPNFPRFQAFWEAPILALAVLSLMTVFSTKSVEAANFHLVGWTNTFIPGGGQLLQGNFLQAGFQAVTEVSTFGYGYSLSKRSPITIDGVPEDYPGVTPSFTRRTKTKYVCPAGKLNPLTKKCSVPLVAQQSISSSSSYSSEPQDLRRPVSAAFLQEIGLKYHMMNVFDSYRQAAKKQGKLAAGQGIDDRDPGEFLMDPFRLDNIIDPWVYIPLLIATGATVLDYGSALKSSPGIQPLTRLTNEFVGFNQLILYPFGSGAPEEMFYRGFVQNEARCLINNGIFSIAMSTLAFSFSHSADGRIGAAVTGTYLGYLAHRNHGKLGKGISLHFWSVVVLGVEAFMLTLNTQRAPPVSYGVTIPF